MSSQKNPAAQAEDLFEFAARPYRSSNGSGGSLDVGEENAGSMAADLNSAAQRQKMYRKPDPWLVMA